MADILTAVGSMVTQAISWVGSFAALIGSTPILSIMCVAVPLVGLGVGLLNRLIRVN